MCRRTSSWKKYLSWYFQKQFQYGPGMDQVLSVLNILLKNHITHNHHVKRIAYNAVTDDVMIIAETGVLVNDDIVGSIEKVNEPKI